MDFSAAAKKAFLYAQDLAHRYRANILLLHVVAPSESSDVSGAASAARKNIASICKAAGVLPSPCKAIIRTGIPFSEITRYADERGVDLIVLGRRDSSMVGKFGEGHTSDRVMRYSKCPVLIVAETGRDFIAMPDGA